MSKIILTMEEAEKKLRTHLPVLYLCISEAWDEWAEFERAAPKQFKPLGPRTRASFIYDHIVDIARHRFDKASGVRLSDERRFLVVSFGDDIVLRFKKLDNSLRASSIRTKQADLFMQQSLPGLEAPTHLIAGYTVDSLLSQVKEIMITCPRGRHNQWVLPIPSVSSVRVAAVATTSIASKSRVKAISKEKKTANG